MIGQSRNTHYPTKQNLGFTIVELLIVIVVIGILAAMTIVAFNGVTSKARVAQMQNDLGNVSKKLKIDQALNGSYPASLSETDNGNGVPSSAGTTYQYSVDNSANPSTFCVTAVNGSTVYHVTDSAGPVAGTCPGDNSTGPPAPTTIAYQDFSTTSSGNTLTVNSLSTIPDGSWMIIDLVSTNAATTVTPPGWTVIVNNDVTNTMRSSVYAKTKSATDTDPLVLNLGSDTSAANGVIFWGAGAGPVNSWIVGTLGKRASNGSQQYITITPTIATMATQTLVLSISNERTTLNESDITSITGATKWFFNPQIGSSKIQTETLSYAVASNPSTSSVVTVTYPNPQSFNGMAFQIGLPPG